MASFSTGSAESSEICTSIGSAANGSTRRSIRRVNSVPFVSSTSGARRPSSTARSGSHGFRSGSPPEIPKHVNPASSASSASRRMRAGSSTRRGARGDDPVRQYAHARLQW